MLYIVKHILFRGVFEFANNLLILIVLIGCSNKTEKGSLFEELPSSITNIEFINEVLDQEDFNIFNYRNFYNGGGVAIGDVNNDSLPDIFLISNMGDNKLYLNRGNFKFEDITQKAGVKGTKAWSTGVTFADVNGDGNVDIYVCNSGNREQDDRSNELFINQGNETFIEKAEAYGLADKGFSTHAAFFDFDRDGDLDMYLLNNSFIPVGQLNYRNFRNERDNLGGHKLFRNDGETFTDVSEQAGIYGSIIGFGLGITLGDVNDDNWLDIFISNDFYERDYLYINNRDGTFRERIKEQMGHISLSSMGADIADINNDGTLDIFVMDMLPANDEHLKQTSTFENYDLYQRKLGLDYHHQIMQNVLQVNNGDGTFSEVARMAKVDATDWSWGALIFDMDNDGLKDIFVANGILRDLTDQDFLRFLGDKNRMEQASAGKKFNYKEFLNQIPSRGISNYAFKHADDLNFNNEAKSWGLEGPGFSNGAAYGDLDNDGDLDLVVNNNNSKASVYRNQSVEKNKTHYIRIKLEGEQKNVNGIGTKIKVYQRGKFQYLQQMPNRGFQSSVDHVLVFGLGTDSSSLDSLEVIWPDDKMKTYKNISIDRELIISQHDATSKWVFQPEDSGNRPFQNVTASSGIAYNHIESIYVDYYRDPFLKQMLSTEGPGLATGDVNGDGLEDVFIGSSRGSALNLFLQTKAGKFEKAKPSAIVSEGTTEIVAMILTDVDNDSDLDLFTVTGSNEFNLDDPNLYDRLYLNDGKGVFTKSDKIPSLPSSGSCVAAADFDKDGDVDLFIGGRSIPGRYGYSPASYLYINDGSGQFKNYTKRFLDTGELGMVTDAAWSDIDHDTYPDLILVGDWMPISVFRNDGGKRLAPVKADALLQSGGWWNCIKSADLDNDGDVDFIVGNVGVNSRIRADTLHPAELYVSDFDGNGAVEQIISCVSEDGKNYPMVLKHDLEKQLPFIKKRFVNYRDYAGKRIDQIFTPQELKDALIRKVYTGATSLLVNEGNWKFSLKKLPGSMQRSSVNAIETIDYNHDGKLDILMAGNFFDVLPELGRYDASYGLLLRNKGGTEFDEIAPKQSGFFIRGQVREMRVINVGNEQRLIAVRCNDTTQVFRVQTTAER
jgi:enediyne biosynthesis protein E4